MYTNRIPSVDLTDFLSEDLNKKNEFVQSIGKAFEEIGFVALNGHFLNSEFNEKLYKEIKDRMMLGDKSIFSGVWGDSPNKLLELVYRN